MSTSSTTPPSLMGPKWESTLPGPPSRSNAGASDISPTGLLAYASGSSITIVDTRSMQLITTLHSLSSTSSSHTPSLSPFITSLRWSPLSLRHVDLLSLDPSLPPPHHLSLLSGDRQGRISLLDLTSRSTLFTLSDAGNSRLGVQDMCWVKSGPDTWAVAAIHGPHCLTLYSTVTLKPFFRYDAVSSSSSDYLSCIRRDPFDSRHVVVLGLRGSLLTVKVMGESAEEVAVGELRVGTDSGELGRLERESGGVSTTAPASAVFPSYYAKCAFSPEWRHVLFVTFPREMVVFDLQYETGLFAATLPRGKFLDVLPDPNSEVVYCVHLDGKLSAWRRRQ